jgi:adenylate kinase family enzyme
MKVILLNGPMGVGKTTIANYIADKYPGTAFIDGDWCMDIHPFVGNRETKEMAIDNILHMTQNYVKSPYVKRVIIPWLMDDEWVVDRLVKGIDELGAEAVNVTLICDRDELIRRWKADIDCPWRTDEWLEVSLKSLEHFSEMDNCINTSGLSVEEAAARVFVED